MTFAAAQALARLFCITLIDCMVAHAQCSVKTVLVRGKVEHAPGKATVRVELVYPKRRPGESGEVTVENGRFSIPIEFLTQSNRPLLNIVPVRCNRKPQTVVITLETSDQEYDRVSLDLSKDFKMAGYSAYALRSEIILKGPS